MRQNNKTHVCRQTIMTHEIKHTELLVVVVVVLVVVVIATRHVFRQSS